MKKYFFYIIAFVTLLYPTAIFAAVTLVTSNQVSIIVANSGWACGDPDRSDFTVYSPSLRQDGTVIVDTQYCASKGGKIWTLCTGGKQNLREVSSLVVGVDMRCSTNGVSISSPSQTTTSALVGNATTITQQTQVTTGSVTDGEGVESACVDLQSEKLGFSSTDITTNGEVSKLQDFLIFKGLLDGSPTGYFGFKTLKAVQAYQKLKAVPQVGRVGSLTKSLVKTDSCVLDTTSMSVVAPSPSSVCRYEENGAASTVFGGTPVCTQALASTGYSAPGLPNVKCVCSNSSLQNVAQVQSGPYVFTNDSSSNGSIVTKIKMTLAGTPSQRLGSLVKVCVTPSVAGSVGTACSKSSDFNYLKDQTGWSYNSSSDTYSVNRVSSADRIPDVEYVSVIRLSDGKKYELKWKAGQNPGTTSTSSSVQTGSSVLTSSPSNDEITIINNSISNGTILTRLKMTVTGAGDNVKACTAQSFSFFGTLESVPPCSKDSEFVILKNQQGWAYNPNTDTYSIDMDAIPLGWPNTTYTTIYKKMSGRIITKTFGPTQQVVVAAPASVVVPAAQASTDITINNTYSGNGSILTRLKMTVTGAGDNVKACTAQSFSFFGTLESVPPCSKDSEFVILKNQQGWSYYPNSDTYAIDMDITAFGWPDTAYTTIFKKTDGSILNKIWGR
ncbi:MAG: peptidoglycan-binding protein [Candidatus Pacebacteria bacterium]|nr:peptidoglycan-binding protein [Candidatus Paceibacterota bacterium]